MPARPLHPLSLLSRPCTLVMAAAGYGKTSTVRDLLRGRTVRWYAASESNRLLNLSGTSLSHLLHPTRTAPDEQLWLVLDDVVRLQHGQLRAVLNAAGQLPEAVRVILLTRYPPASGGLDNWRRRGVLGVLTAADLALSADETAVVLRGAYGLSDPALVQRVHGLTGGWAALVHLLGRSIMDGPVRAGQVHPSDEDSVTAEAYLTQQVIAELPAQARRVLRQAAHLDPVSPSLIMPAGHDPAGYTLRRLSDAGLLGPARPDGSGYPPVPILARVVRRTLPVPAAQRVTLLTRAAARYAEHGPLIAALRAYRQVDDAPAVARLLHRRGTELLSAGGCNAIVSAVETLPRALRSPALRMLYGDALHTTGDTAAAIGVYRSIAGRANRLDPALAARYCAAHYLRGEPAEALAVFARTEIGQPGRAEPGQAGHVAPATGNPTGGHRAAAGADAQLLSWVAMVHGLTGDVAACVAHAQRALAAAHRANTPEALAAAHIAAGLGARLRGDRAVAGGHLNEAIRAETGEPACGTACDPAVRPASGAATRPSVTDRRLTAWIRVNRAAALVNDARYQDALAEADQSADLARATGFPGMLALALAVRGTALARLGRLDEAAAHYEHSIELHQRTGSHLVAGPLSGLADVHRLRGHDSLARAAYEESIRISELHGNLRVLVPALAGLARVTARAGDLTTAADLAERAARLVHGTETTAARCALGWVALAGADHARAARIAVDAADAARLNHDPAGLAEALVLRASAVDDPEQAREAYTEAAAILREASATLGVDRISVLLGQLPGAGPRDRVEARLAAARLTEAGVPVPGPTRRPNAAPPVAVRTLGRFEVVVAGRVVPQSAWQSRKARDLLRILTARRGRPLSREQLGDLLWPDENSSRVAHRLSVALSIVRGVLDPARQALAGRYIVADRSSIALDLGLIELDVELFHGEALHGLRLFDRDEIADARTVLTVAEQRYQGDFLADDPYDEWAVPLREETRRLYVRVVRALAALGRRGADLELAAQYLRRALEVEPYDERTHQELIGVLTAAGRHGEADQAYLRYAQAMRAVGVTPQPRRRPAPPDAR